jgi:signal peptidase I
MPDENPSPAPRPSSEPTSPPRAHEIVLNPRHAVSLPAIAPQKKPDTKPPENKDGYREVVETVVFVVVLVLLLKTFLAEAFVIPTGSMATTLLGYNYEVTCQQCGYPFLVNASKEADPQRGESPDPAIGSWCPNCANYNPMKAPPPPAPPQGAP